MSQRLRKPRVLLVEDDRADRDALRGALEEAGYDVRIAANCLKLVASLEVEPPDALLVDARTTWIDSANFCGTLCRRSSAPPVLLLSHEPAPHETQKLQRLGVREVLPRPVNRNQLVQRLRELLGATPQDTLDAERGD
jgi:two-component system response regulator MprA